MATTSGAVTTKGTLSTSARQTLENLRQAKAAGVVPQAPTPTIQVDQAGLPTSTPTIPQSQQNAFTDFKAAQAPQTTGGFTNPPFGTGGLPTNTATGQAGGIVQNILGQQGLPTQPPKQLSPVEQATQMIGDVLGPDSDRQGQVDQIVQAMEKLSETKQTEFDRLFGADSQLQKVFLPTTRAIEQQILDTEELLTSLRTDIQEGSEDVGLTQGQFRRIEAKERGDLVGQMDQLTRSLSRAQAGFQNALALSQAEFDNLLDVGQQNIDAMKFGLEQSGLFDKAQVDLIGSAFQADLNEQAAVAAEERRMAQETRADDKNTQNAIQQLLLDGQQLALRAGVVPGENYNQLIKDVQKMAEDGASLAEIQNAILQTVGGNPQVAQFIMQGFKKFVGGGGSSTINTTADAPANTDTGLPDFTKFVLGTSGQGREILEEASSTTAPKKQGKTADDILIF